MKDHYRKIQEALDSQEKAEIPSETILDVGRTVFCDACGEEWTNRIESGGFLFGSHAYCPICAKESFPTIQQYREEKFIKAYCPNGMSFADWCRHLRGNDNTIKIRNYL